MNSIDYTSPYTGRQLSNVYTYMGWQMITDSTSEQYRLRAAAGQTFDSEGFGVIQGRYVIACTDPADNGGMFGTIGDYIDWTLANGQVLKTVVGDTKSAGDSTWIPIGHLTNDDNPAASTSVSVIEFVVDKTTWYSTAVGGSAPSMHANPGTSTCHPEWAGQIQGWQKVGTYWDGEQSGSAGVDGGTGSNYSSIKYIEQAGGDMLLVHFPSGDPMLCYKSNGGVWLPSRSANTPTSDPETPVPPGVWARASEALAWCEEAKGWFWDYKQDYTADGVYRGPGLVRGNGCDCSGFVGKMLYNFAPDIYQSCVNAGTFDATRMPSTYDLWNAFETVWDSSTASEDYPQSVRVGDIALFSSGWYAGQYFPDNYTPSTRRHVFIYMPDGYWWDMVKPYGPSNENFDVIQTTDYIWTARGQVRATRSCVVRPNYR